MIIKNNTTDIKEYFEEIYNYLRKQNDIDKTLLDKVDTIEKLLKNIERKYERTFEEK